VKRTPLKRGKPLARGGYLERYTPIAPINRERRQRVRANQYHGPDRHAAWVCAQGCQVAGRVPSRCWGPLDPAHVRPVSVGGTWEDLVCLCRGHHQESGEQRTTQRHEFEIRLDQALEDLAADNVRRHAEEPPP
jgi:hypothetical protein